MLMAMDVLSLARFQFAMTTVFHFFFVPFSIGMGLVAAIMETMYVRKKDETYKKMAKFWGKIFLLSFAVGVVTGIIQEFQFGMNWSNYSRFMGTFSECHWRLKPCWHSSWNRLSSGCGCLPGTASSQLYMLSLFG